MRNFLLLFLLLMPVIGSCTDDYDDSAAWKDIDGIYKDLDQLKEKLNNTRRSRNLLLDYYHQRTNNFPVGYQQTKNPSIG